MARPLVIDGARGEGGGQIVRTSCALSIITGTPVRVIHVRAGRAKPGLAKQHATAVLAAARVGGGQARGATVRSQEIELWPGQLTPGRHHFPIGTAGATTLVLQTIVLPLALAGSPSEIHLEGGTHNVKAPPFEFLEQAYLPLLERIAGARVAELSLERAGFYPAGGGSLRARIDPVTAFGELQLLERGALRSARATATVWNLPRHIAERELGIVEAELGWKGASLQAVARDDSFGPGNSLSLSIGSEHVTEIVTGMGERGVPAERVAKTAVKEAAEYLAAEVPVGEHLADQLLLPMALGRGGVFRSVRPTLHTTTHAEVIRAFLDVAITIEQESERVFRVSVHGANIGGAHARR
jgi:RNA 3'-terminal phosphate cyclase (ATP)